MWHFGSDSVEYAGERFECTWQDGENALIRNYTKDHRDGKGIRIRRERQEQKIRGSYTREIISREVLGRSTTQVHIPGSKL
jgi:hypothetical protein